MISFVSRWKSPNGKSGGNAASLALSCALVLFAAALMCLLLFAVVSPDSSAKRGLAALGHFLYSAYGVTSFLIPAFLLACAISLIVQNRGFPLYFLLLISVIPFFTAYGGERLIRAVLSTSGASFLSKIIFFGLFISTVLAVVTEYLVFFQLSGYAEKKLFSGRRNPESHAEGASADLEDLQKGDSTAAEENAPPSPLNEDEAFAALQAMQEPSVQGESSASLALLQEVREEGGEFVSSIDFEQDIEQNSRESAEPSATDQELERVNSFAAEAIGDEGAINGESEEAPADPPLPQEAGEETARPEEGRGEGELPPAKAEFESPPLPAAFPDKLEDAAFAEFFRPFKALEEKDFWEEDTAKKPESLVPKVEFNPEMFEGYIAGNFSVIDGSDTLAFSREASALDLSPMQEKPDSPALVTEGEEARAEDSGIEAKSAEQSLIEGASAFKLALPAPAGQAAPSPCRLKYSIDCSVLNSYPDGEYWVIDEDTHEAAAILKDTLSEFNIKADVTGIRKGPVITMFEILPAPGVKLSRIVGLQDNMALRLAASSIRIVAPIPGKHAVGIEVPNKKRSIVSFRELIETESPALSKMDIPVMLGKDIAGEAQIIDLASTPHLLIAGSTGSGKSVCVNSIILSILYKKAPAEVRLLLIDPKVVELKLYNDIGHLLSPVITEPKRAFQALQYCLCEMERRYAMLDGMGVRNIKEYNRRIEERFMATEKLPYIVVIIDEFADLMATTGKELESAVARLAAMSRAVGIHLVLATQRPSIDVITGLIKANIPSRIAFMVASKIDSRIIIDQVGAEKLLGKGDMLYSSVTDPFPVRIQGAFVSDEEVERVVEQVRAFGEPEYIDDEIFVDDDDEDSLDAQFFSGEDPLYDKALDIVLSAGKASASYIQRRLKIGYNRAARLVEEMEARGIVGPANGSKAREVIHAPDKMTQA